MAAPQVGKPEERSGHSLSPRLRIVSVIVLGPDLQGYVQDWLRSHGGSAKYRALSLRERHTDLDVVWIMAVKARQPARGVSA